MPSIPPPAAPIPRPRVASGRRRPREGQGRDGFCVMVFQGGVVRVRVVSVSDLPSVGHWLDLALNTGRDVPESRRL